MGGELFFFQICIGQIIKRLSQYLILFIAENFCEGWVDLEDNAVGVNKNNTFITTRENAVKLLVHYKGDLVNAIINFIQMTDESDESDENGDNYLILYRKKFHHRFLSSMKVMKLSGN